MTFYQELIERGGFSNLSNRQKAEKKDIIFLSMDVTDHLGAIFCVAFVTGFSILFGSDNSIVE